MRGSDERSGLLFSYVDLETRVRKDQTRQFERDQRHLRILGGVVVGRDFARRSVNVIEVSAMSELKLCRMRGRFDPVANKGLARGEEIYSLDAKLILAERTQRNVGRLDRPQSRSLTLITKYKSSSPLATRS
jgi:hypothetical protein